MKNDIIQRILKTEFPFTHWYKTSNPIDRLYNAPKDIVLSEEYRERFVQLSKMSIKALKELMK